VKNASSRRSYGHKSSLQIQARGKKKKKQSEGGSNPVAQAPAKVSTNVFLVTEFSQKV